MTPEQAHKALIIFIRNIEKGKVKTRLAKSLGDEEALRIYIKLLGHARHTAAAVEAERYVYYSHFVEAADEWRAPVFHKALQQGDDLGARMGHAFEEVLQSHTKAVIIGSDCASLTPHIVEEAFAALDEHPYVLGPALDGGYYLLGMRQPSPSLFSDMAWSTPEVASITLRRIAELGGTAHLLPALSDIDEAADWEQYGF